MAKKRVLSTFESVLDLELEDKEAAKLRRKQNVKDVARAKAAQCQTKIYGHLMECRILLQRTIQQQQQNPGSAEVKDTELIQSCDDLIGKLLQARKRLLRLETSANDNKIEGAGDHDDLCEVLQSEYESCKEEWKETLNRRHQDLRLHAGLAVSTKTFRVMDSSFWQQVDATVAHDEVRRRSTPAADQNVEFEDNKVYQQMLKDFLVTASSASNGAGQQDPNAPFQRWKSSAPKKQVDRRASKGRKIRYAEIPKLVNFTFPVSRSTTTNLDEDEWFQSLFGGVGSERTS